MITRRRFLEGSMATLILIPLVGCSDDDDSPTGTGGTTTNCQGTLTTGSNVQSHAHTVCVPTTDLNSPPASGATYGTSSGAGHAHAVTLSQTQLQSIASGSTVVVTSTSSGAHTHTFSIQMA